MTNIPISLRYAETHEWARRESDGTVTVGVSDHAQDSLGEIVVIEFPLVGHEYRAGDPVAVVESSKSASDVHAPVSGFVIAINTDLINRPSDVNVRPYEHWLFKINPTDLDEYYLLLTPEDYAVKTG
ncbi:glycine cleavage system protein GcvH [Pseudomonas sp. RC10]|uniref:glycine cleavage system protein GcvH n=1 Tax=Pseudomonas bambusae TaxID=3139142 RepID=UPI00313A1062